eukprot:jgi/Botrbrau1/4368/Bobra.105_2s0014.1
MGTRHTEVPENRVKSAMAEVTASIQPVLSGGSSLVFTDSGLEARYIVHRAAATRGASASLRQVLFLALTVGYTRCVYAAVVGHRWLCIRFFVLSVLFFIGGFVQLYTVHLLRIPETVHRHEWIRSVSLVCTFLSWLVLNILLKAGETPRTSPVMAALYGTALIVADGLRLYAASQLIMLNLICFLLATAGAVLDGAGAPPPSGGSAGGHRGSWPGALLRPGHLGKGQPGRFWGRLPR